MKNQDVMVIDQFCSYFYYVLLILFVFAYFLKHVLATCGNCTYFITLKNSNFKFGRSLYELFVLISFKGKCEMYRLSLSTIDFVLVHKCFSGIVIDSCDQFKCSIIELLSPLC